MYLLLKVVYLFDGQLFSLVIHNLFLINTTHIQTHIHTSHPNPHQHHSHTNPHPHHLTSKPTSTPFTFKPTSTPFTSKPTSTPFTSKPTSTPFTSNPTSTPFTSKPTSTPFTSKPTSTPFTSKPTSTPHIQTYIHTSHPNPHPHLTSKPTSTPHIQTHIHISHPNPRPHHTHPNPHPHLTSKPKLTSTPPTSKPTSTLFTSEEIRAGADKPPDQANGYINHGADMSTDETDKLPPLTIGQKKRRSSAPTVAAPGGNQIVIARTPLTQVAYDDLHLNKDALQKTTLLEKVKRNMYCSKRRIWKLMSTYVPLIKYIRYYKLKENSVADIVAGITVGIVHIPQALAFGQLTSVKVENGLFTSLWPVLLYVIFGTSAHVSMGTSAVICILTAATVDREGQAWAASRPWIMNQTGNGTILDDLPEYMDFKENLAMAITLITGIMMIAMGFLKLGFITAYLSESFFTAFTSAAAVHIGISQVPAMLGIKIKRYGGAFKIVFMVRDIFTNITEANVAAILCAIISCVIILLVKDCVNERFKHKLYAPIPIELFIVIFGTVASYFGDFRTEYKVDVVGTIPTEIPVPSIPVEGLKLSSNYMVDCFILAILIFANTIAMGKICAKKHNYEIDDNQEMLAYGMCNAFSSFFNCFPSSVSPPRSMVASSMNARTTLNGIFVSILMLLVILIVSRLFTELPKAVLAAIIFIALKGLFIQIIDGRKFWRINKFDFVIWFFTFFATVFIDIDMGLGIGVGVSLITVVFQTQFARGYKLGFTKSDPCFVEHKKYRDSTEIPGIKIFRFQSSLYFANAEIFRNTLYRCTVNPRKLLKGLKKREKRLAKLNNERMAQGLPPEDRRNSIMMGEVGLASHNSSSSLNKYPITLTETERNSMGKLTSSESAQAERIRRVSLPNMEKPKFQSVDEEQEMTNNNGDLGIPSSNIVAKSPNPERYSSKQVNGSGTGTLEYSKRRGSTFSIDFDDFEEDPDDGDELFTDEKLRQMRKIHHIILDCSIINYLDASGSNVLSHIFTEYGHVNIKVFLAGCSADMRRAMEHAGAFDKIPRNHLFIDIHDAIAIAKPERILPLEAEALEDFSDEEAIEDSYVTKM